MRALRGANVVPVVLLDQAPMKTENFGHEVAAALQGRRLQSPPGGGGDDECAADAAVADAAAQRPDRCSGSRTEPCSECGSGLGVSASPPPAPETKAASTLDQMKSAKPVTVGEIINDELPPWA